MWIHAHNGTNRINIACFSHRRAPWLKLYLSTFLYTWIFTGVSFSMWYYYWPLIWSDCLNRWEWMNFWTLKTEYRGTTRTAMRNHRKCLFGASFECDHSWIAVRNFVGHWRRRSFAFHRFIVIFMSCLGVSRNHMFRCIGWLVCLRLNYGLKAAWQCLHSKKIRGSSHHILMITMARKRKSERLCDRMVCERERPHLSSCMLISLLLRLRLWCVRRVHTPFNTLILA